MPTSPATATLFPYTTLFRSHHVHLDQRAHSKRRHADRRACRAVLGREEALIGLVEARIVALELGQIAAALEHMRKIDRKSTRLNSSHVAISYAVFCLKKKQD